MGSSPGNPRFFHIFHFDFSNGRTKQARNILRIAAKWASESQIGDIPLGLFVLAYHFCCASVTLSVTLPIKLKSLTEQRKKMSDTEAPVEVKKRGRPAKNKDAVAEKEAKKRGHSASPKKDKSPAVKESAAAENENGEAPAKRGRGRPPKGSKGAGKKTAAAAKPKGTSGRGRGRPPKAKPPASSEDNDDDEEEEEEDEEA
uniref:Uncharacterized protein n=2 Tax=Lutzomyia longipalpis TaxID=7200 RepID=A0A1B0CRE4_LUTLO